MSHDVDEPAPHVDQDPLAQLASTAYRWRAELTDLGGRNSLMWHRDLPTGTIDLTVAHPGGVAKLLAGHNTLLSELVRESVALEQARRRVGAIRGKALELQREFGLSTLFLGVGMASWNLPRAPIPPRAPVLLRGARIRPTDATWRDYVLRLDSDVMFNPALEHYLRGEAGLELDGHDLARASLGRHGFDPRPTYDQLEALCARIPQFGIGPQLVLSTYPLAKLPLVAELVDPVERLAERTLLLALAARGTESQAEGEPTDPGPGESIPAAEPPSSGMLDEVAESPESTPPETPADTAELDTVLDADASQRAVLHLAGSGTSVLLDAVPGTGRTQTIANAVAQAALAGRSTLVVAQRRRALEEVAERLGAAGLADLVLDLRETPAAARRVAAELIDALDRHQADARRDGEGNSGQGAQADGRLDGEQHAAAGTAGLTGAGAAGLTEPLAVLREHEEHLHGTREPWGVTLAQTQDVLTRLASLPHPPSSHVRLEPQVLSTLTPDSISQVRDALTRAVNAGAWKGRGEDPWFGAQITTPEEAERAAGIVADLVGGSFSQARDEVVRLTTEVGLPAPVNLQQWTRTYELLRSVRDTLDVFTAKVYEAPLDDLVRATTRQPKGSADKLPVVTKNRLRRQARGLLRPGVPPPDLGDRLTHARDERAEWVGLAGRAARPAAPRGWEDAAQDYAAIHRDLTWLGEVLHTTAHGPELETMHLDVLLERLVRLDAQSDRLPVVAAVHGDLQPLRDRGLGALVEELAHRGVAAEHVEAEVDLVFWASVHDQISTRDGQPTSADLHAALRDLDAQDRARTESARAAVRDTVRGRVAEVLAQHPAQESALRGVVDAGPPLKMLDLLAAAPDLVQALRPCWLVSPLIVPATIPVTVEFDLLVLDEAERLPVSHAVPALSRSDVVLAVGDAHGLPPVPFVSVVDEQAAAPEPATESVLEGLAAALPVRHLTAHYRAVDQRMLPRRPSPEPAGFPGVLLPPRVTAEQTSGEEGLVDTLVDVIIEHARFRAEQSLGVLVDDPAVVTLVEQALRSRVGEEPDLIGSFREDVAEPFLLSTPKRAAGDVRDRIVLALTGRADLSAAVARSALGSARQAVVVVSDGGPDQLPESNGVTIVRQLLHTAHVPPDEGDAEDEADLPALLVDLASRLRAEDLTVRVGYGTGPHRIELVVDDPDRPKRPLLAIDTDARPDPGGPHPDRLRSQPRHLTALGWSPVRVWTTDVFRDPAREVARLVAAARAASAERRR